MLKLKYLFENFALAEECLKRYDAEEESLSEFLPHFRISSNAVYPFWSVDADRLCFLRLSPSEEKSAEDVLSELRLILWLREQGFPAMKPHPMRDGRLFCRAETPWGVWNVSCFESVGGKTLEDCEGSLRLIRGYGKTLGHMHRLLKRYPCPDTRQDHAALMQETRKRLLSGGAPEALTAEWEKVNGELAALGTNADTYGVIHYDFEADNVLYSAKRDAFGVIDFDDALRGWYALDAARAIDSLTDVAEDADAAEAEAEFLTGYREETPFTEAQVSSMPLLRRLVRLEEYAGILHVLSEPVEDAPEWMDEITGKLTRRLRSIESELN